MLLNSYDIHLILSLLANKIEEIKSYDKENVKLSITKDYRNLYFKLRKELLTRYTLND